MKKLILLSAIALSGLMYQPAKAQIRFGIHVNLGGPVYTPQAPVYDDADYYYLPDVEAYYSVSRHCYFYNDGYNWVSAAYLPGRYHDFDLEHARRYEVRESRPYLHNDEYRARFGGTAEHFDWNRTNDHDRAYANQDRFEHNQYRGNDHNQYQQRSDVQRNYQQNGSNYGRGQQQPQQQNNTHDFGGRPQAQPQQNEHSNRENDNRGGGYDRHGI